MQLTILINYHSSLRLAKLSILDNNKQVLLKNIGVSTPLVIKENYNVSKLKITPNNELFQYDEDKKYSNMLYNFSKQFGVESLVNEDNQIILSGYKNDVLAIDKTAFLVNNTDLLSILNTIGKNQIEIVTVKNKFHWFSKTLSEKIDLNRNYKSILDIEAKLNDDMSFYSSVSEIQNKRNATKSNLIIHKNKDLLKSLNHIESLAISEDSNEDNDITFEEPKKA